MRTFMKMNLVPNNEHDDRISISIAFVFFCYVFTCKYQQ